MISHGNLISLYTKKISKKENLSDEEKIEILSSIIKPKKYIGYVNKQEIIKDIIKNNVSSEFHTTIYYNSCNLYYYFICMLINVYYDIEIDDNTYDKLCSHDILGYLLVMLGDEYEIFKNILDSYMSDLKNGNLLLESL